MKSVIHQNFYDENGNIYCKKKHAVMNQDLDLCDNCEYCFGSLQGAGVECLWEDNCDAPIVSPETPEEELQRVSLLIENKVLKPY